MRIIQKLEGRLLYRVVDIQHDILHDHGVNLSYKHAWLGKEVARGVLHRREMTSYDLLLTNLGSIAIVEKNGDRLKHAFFSFRAYVVGFKKGCRVLLFLDGTHLLGKYEGTLLGVTGKSGKMDSFISHSLS